MTVTISTFLLIFFILTKIELNTHSNNKYKHNNQPKMQSE